MPPRKVNGFTVTHTEQSAVIKNFVKAYLEQNKYPPTVEEIADALGVTKSTAHSRLRIMRDYREISFDEKKSRSFVLPGEEITFS